MRQAYNIPAHVRQTLGEFPSAIDESVRDSCEAVLGDANIAVPCSSIDSRANTRHLITACCWNAHYCMWFPTIRNQRFENLK